MRNTFYSFSMYSRSSRTGGKGGLNNSTPSYQMQQVPDRREEKLSARSLCYTLPSHKTRSSPISLPEAQYTKTFPKQYQHHYILYNQNWNSSCWDVLYSTFSDISWPTTLPPPSCLCLVSMLSLLLVNKTPFWKSWSETGTSTDYLKYT